MTNKDLFTHEYGVSKPPFENIIKLCQLLEISSDYLLGLSDIKERR